MQIGKYSALIGMSLILGVAGSAHAEGDYDDSFTMKPVKQQMHKSHSKHSHKKHMKEGGTSHHFASSRPGAGRPVFIFSPAAHAWAAYDSGGRLVRTGRASGGKGYCPDIHRGCHTPRGVFTVHSKGGPGCKSTRYPVGRGGAPMPYCMFFSKYYAVHGSNDVPNYNASHGCIRVTPSEASWLSHNFMTIGTKVIVTSY